MQEVKYHPKVEEFLLMSIQSPKAQKKAVRKFQHLERYGIGQLRKAGEAEPVKGIKEKMEEIKIKGDKMEYRFFGGAILAGIYGVFHGCIKKGKKLKRNEIETALGRRREMIDAYAESPY